jgi:hypothetical protein
MPTFSPAYSALPWIAYNLETESLRLTGIPILRVRYESVTSDAVRELDRITSHLIKSARPTMDTWCPTEIPLREPQHMLSGNPVRFEHVRLRIQPDEDWRQSMTTRDTTLVAVLSAPLLARYGYVPASRRRSQRAAYDPAPPRP